MMDCQLLVLLLFGLIVGDYWLQTNNQAINKKVEGRLGRTACIAHCVSFSAAVVLVLIASQVYVAPPWVWVTVFVQAFWSHYPLDRTNFVGWFLGKVKGYEPPEEGAPTYAFIYYALIHTVVDNSFHLVLMYILIAPVLAPYAV